MKQYLIILLKGMAMGAADVVPGVSGGTIAFIAGIYDRLLSAINAVNFSLIKLFKTQGITAVWKKIDGNFLAFLILGIAISIISLAKLMTHLLTNQAILTWAFFFGLIIASILYVGKQVSSWNWQAILGLMGGTLLVLAISLMPQLGDSNSLLYIFICGVIAICAMILPGISGSFLLLILGAYHTILAALVNRDIIILGTFIAGAAIGLLSFSRFLKWILDHYNNTTIAVLTGFLVGSLYKIWPWKTTTEFRINSHGENVPFIQKNIWSDEQLILAIIAALGGFLLIYLIEFIAKKLNKKD